MNVQAAIKSAAADGEISDAEAKSIDAAAKAAKMSEDEVSEAVASELDKNDAE